MTEHRYVSTACLHEAEAIAAGDTVRADELHAYCAGETGVVGAKTPAKCKFCPAVCECRRHVEDAPETALSAPIAAEQPPAGGTGSTEAAETISAGAICGHCGGPLRGYGSAGGVKLCHPDNGLDCYSLVTLSGHTTPCPTIDADWRYCEAVDDFIAELEERP